MCVPCCLEPLGWLCVACSTARSQLTKPTANKAMSQRRQAARKQQACLTRAARLAGRTTGLSHRLVTVWVTQV